jgi:hypothetical protein
MKMLKVHQNTPTSMLKSENFSGITPPDPRIKRGEEGREGLGRVWKGGNRCLAHPKLSRGAPYDYSHEHLCFSLAINFADNFTYVTVVINRICILLLIDYSITFPLISIIASE